jgi:hypothetical protein
VTEAAVERLDLEDPAVVIRLLVGDPRDLELHQAGACGQGDPFCVAFLTRAGVSGPMNYFE